MTTSTSAFLIVLVTLIVTFTQTVSSVSASDLSTTSRNGGMTHSTKPTMTTKPTIGPMLPKDEASADDHNMSQEEDDEETKQGLFASPDIMDDSPQETEDPMLMTMVTTAPKMSATPKPMVTSPDVPNAYMSCRCIEEGRQCTPYIANKSAMCMANTPRNYQVPSCYWNCCLLCMVNRESAPCKIPAIKRLCAQQFYL